MAHPELTPSFSLFTKSKNLIMANVNTYGLIYLLPFLMGLFSTIRSSRMDRLEGVTAGSYGIDISGAAFGFGLLFGLAMIILYVLVSLASYALNYQTSVGEKPTISELWPVVQKYGWRLIGLFFAIGFMVLFGLIALVVPGLIFLRRYYLAPYVMLDKDLSIGAAMKESARISKPHSGSVWSLIGVSIVLSLPGVIPVFGWLVSFVLTTLYAVAPALRYQELKKLAPKA